MLAEYGEAVVEELERIDKSTRKYTVAELQELEAEFKDKTKKLLESDLVGVM